MSDLWRFVRYERSSIGRAPVSKTGGWGFDSLRSCCREAVFQSAAKFDADPVTSLI